MAPLPRRFRQRHAIVWFVLCAFLVLGVAVAAFSWFSARLSALQEGTLLGLVDFKRGQIEAVLTDQRDDARLLAGRLSVRALLRSPARPAPETIDNLHEAYAEDRIFLFDRSGAIAYPRDAVRVEPEIEAAVAEVLADPKRIFVDQHASVDGQLDYGFMEPVFDRAGPGARLLGAAYLGGDPRAHFSGMLMRRQAQLKSAEWLLVRPGHEPGSLDILSDNHSRAEPLTPIVTLRTSEVDELGRHALASARGVVRDARDRQGQLVRAVISDIPGTSWRLVAKVDIDEVEGPERLLRWVIGALALVMLAASAFGVRLVWRASEARLALAAERAERSSRGLIETAVDGALRVDRHGRILDVNRSLCEMTGYSREELLSKTLADVEDNLPPEAIGPALARIKENGHTRFTTRWKRRDGTLIDFDATTSYAETDGEDVFFGFVRDLTDELRRNRQLERLNLFYRFMRDIEVGLREAREPAGMLRVYTETAVARAGPVLAWGGVLDPLSGEVDIFAAAGTAAEYARGLRITNDALRPEGQGPSGRALREGRTQVVNDFQSNGMTGLWHEQARRFDIRSNVSVPILVEGKVVGVIAVYAREPNFFDEAMVELVDESVRTLALAWAAAHHVQERDAERERRLASEDRYQRIFEFSWMPMQLHSLPDMDLVAVNSAYRARFGFTLDEVRGQAWRERQFPDPAVRAAVEQETRVGLEALRGGGGPQSSPLIAITTRDGSQRLGRGHMTLAGDDLVLAWEDLTEVTQAQQALSRSEQRFRSMVEQSLAGVFVVSDGHWIYVNPAFVRMLGASGDELLGRDPLDFLDDSSRADVLEDRQRLAAGEPMLHHEVTMRRVDGTPVVMLASTAFASWDERQVVVGYVEDITERNRTREEIRGYLARLEASMQSTLRVISRMVDLRDPYTAGHERRVGLLCSAIARELGWEERRCRSMEMIGLIHDIGKLAIPAEILIKPAALTANEYELVKGHAEAGYEILKDLQFDELPVAEIIRQHHERQNGSGYPRGLKGDEILVEARVLGVADVLESMMSYRPYRGSLGMETTLAELEANRGILYDPDVVDAVLRLIRERGYWIPD